MEKRVSAAEAKAGLSALLAEVANGGVQVVIERRGKALAALISMGDLALLCEQAKPAAHPRGALALVGGWADVSDDDIDALVDHIYADRERDEERPVELEP